MEWVGGGGVGLFRKLFNSCNFRFSKGEKVYLTKIHNENFFAFKRWKMRWFSLILPNVSWKMMKIMIKSTNFTKLFTEKMKNPMNFIKKCEKINDKYYLYESETPLNFPISKGCVGFTWWIFQFPKFSISKGVGLLEGVGVIHWYTVYGE